MQLLNTPCALKCSFQCNLKFLPCLIYIYVCVCTYTHACCAHTHTHTHIYIYKCVHTSFLCFLNVPCPFFPSAFFYGQCGSSKTPLLTWPELLRKEARTRPAKTASAACLSWNCWFQLNRSPGRRKGRRKKRRKRRSASSLLPFVASTPNIGDLYNAE